MLPQPQLRFADAWNLPQPTLQTIERLDAELLGYYSRKIQLDPRLSRATVSFQASKVRPAYRWYKYKEAFSPDLVVYLLTHYAAEVARLIDPFAGSGTALFAASTFGTDADGVELLPLAQELIRNRSFLQSHLLPSDADAVRAWIKQRPWESTAPEYKLRTLRITQGAYPAETVAAIERYITSVNREDTVVRTVLQLALLSVLESVSYTRKDGQYLRWDDRSGRKAGKKSFNKGPIPAFGRAVTQKVEEILVDLLAAALVPPALPAGQISLLEGSCLNVLPTLPDQSYGVILTSPPYCNRYDYTRTYALELAALGLTEIEMTALRQEMVSSTVENREKDLAALNPKWEQALGAAEHSELLQSILAYLVAEKDAGRLNNAGIPRMVRGYFYEMACVISECARLLTPGGRVLMVNDNVRYAGASVSVDLILSAIAESLGFEVEAILVLPNSKGNSSQQMSVYGREQLRKCVYVWRKT